MLCRNKFMTCEQKDRKSNPYWEGYRNNDVAEDDYSEESNADSVYIEKGNLNVTSEKRC